MQPRRRMIMTNFNIKRIKMRIHLRIKTLHNLIRITTSRNRRTGCTISGVSTAEKPVLLN